MSPKERFISSRVTGRKVLGSANPLAKGFREGKVKGIAAEEVFRRAIADIS